MSKDKISTIATLLTLLVVIVGFVAVYNKDSGAFRALGAAGNMLAENYIPYVMYNDGYTSEKGIVLSGASGDITTGDDLTVTDDATVSGGSLTVTTTNTATSTAIIGCIQTYATSTATAVRLVLSNVGSTTATYGGTTANGGVSWEYGSCPR